MPSLHSAKVLPNFQRGRLFENGQALRNRDNFMSIFFKRVWYQDRGVLTFEWILLITVLVIGIVGGISAVRDAVIDELGDVAGAVVNIDQSYSVEASPCPEDAPLGNSFGFEDTVPECPPQQNPGRQRREFTAQDAESCPAPESASPAPLPDGF